MLTLLSLSFAAPAIDTTPLGIAMVWKNGVLRADPADNAPSARAYSWTDRENHGNAAWSFQLLERQHDGAWLRSGDDIKASCVESNFYLQQLELLFWVKSEDLVQTTVKPVEWHHSDGTGAVLPAGVPLLPGKNDLWWVMGWWRYLMPLPTEAVGWDYVPSGRLPAAEHPKDYVGVPEGTALRLGGNPVLEPPSENPEHAHYAYRVQTVGKQTLLEMEDNCGRIRMMADSSALKSAPGGYGSIGGNLPKWTVEAHRPIWWDNGQSAGRVGGKTAYLVGELSRAGERSCIPMPLLDPSEERPASTTRICFEAADLEPFKF